MPTLLADTNPHYALMEKAIDYLCEHFREQPTLAQAAAFAGLSESHFQRCFQDWVGITPKQFVQYLTADYARQRLQACKDTLRVSDEAGLSSGSRLHDLMVKIYAATPAELKNQGTDLTLYYDVHATPFGPCLIALSERGLCHLAFIDGSEKDELENIRQAWPGAQLIRDFSRTAEPIQSIFLPQASPMEMKLHLKGSSFQIKVWEALLRIPSGTLVTYEEIAAHIGQPQAYRAVATAIGKNSIAVLIPCHRVIRNSGVVGQYRWGTARKRMILGWEAAQQHLQGP